MKRSLHVLLLLFMSLTISAHAQTLDLDDPSLKPGVRRNRAAPKAASPPGSSDSNVHYTGKPFTAKISKVRYLPREIFGQWSLSSKLLNTNDPNMYSPAMNDIWLFEKQGDQLIISNPVTGGHISIDVEKVEGKTAYLTREIVVSRKQSIQENFTIRVSGNTLAGQSLQKVRTLKGGKVVRETFGLYQIEARRIGQSSAQFRPVKSQEPDIEIKELRFR